MKPLLLLCAFALFFPLAARAQFAPQTVAQNSAVAVPVPAFGLSVLDDKGREQSLCPLQRTDVRADISGQMARVVVVQQFSNPSTGPIEALYTFPLPHDAAVDGMTFRIGERTINGEIKKREEAAQIYQQAKTRLY